MTKANYEIFVTGGAGFIGSAFVRLLLAETAIRITNFDALTYAGNLDNLEGLDETRHRFVHGNIADSEAVNSALAENTYAIVNFAAESHVDRSITDAAEFLRTNITGTQVLLDAARARGIKRFIQVSTDEVMGSLPETKRPFLLRTRHLPRIVRMQPQRLPPNTWFERRTIPLVSTQS